MSFRHTFIAALLSAACLWGIALYAQKKSAKKIPVPKEKEKVTPADTVAVKKVVRNFLPDVYLGHSDFRGGDIKKTVFDSLMKQGLNSHDSLGNNYRVQSFNFTYGERTLYEDSVANLQIITDYLLEFCPGDTVSAGISANLYQRTKASDTIYIDKIQVARLRGNTVDSISIMGKPMKCVIMK